MAVLPIAAIGHPVLRTPTRPVGRDELASVTVQALIDDMIDTMRHAGGAGIAANQVHAGLRIATIEVRDNPRYPYKPPIPLTVIVNPTIRPLDDATAVINEGCLSVPLRGDLVRSMRIEVTSLDRHGEPQTIVSRGLAAGTFQHEVDHLDGRLIVDRIDPSTLATWEQWTEHEREASVARMTSIDAAYTT